MKKYFNPNFYCMLVNLMILGLEAITGASDLTVQLTIASNVITITCYLITIL